MTDKEQFVSDWLKSNPQDDSSDAHQAWKDHIKFVNSFFDWDDQIEDD